MCYMYCCRLVQHASSDDTAMLELLESMLTTSAHFQDDLAIRCATAHQTVRRLALYAGTRFIDLASQETSDSKLHARLQLVQVLQRHANQTSWAAALLQVPVGHLAAILPALLHTASEVPFQYQILSPELLAQTLRQLLSVSTTACSQNAVSTFNQQHYICQANLTRRQQHNRCFPHQEP